MALRKIIIKIQSRKGFLPLKLKLQFETAHIKLRIGYFFVHKMI